MMQTHSVTYTRDPAAHGIATPCHCTMCGRLIGRGEVVAVDVVEREESGPVSDLLTPDELRRLMLRCGYDGERAARYAGQMIHAPHGFRLVHSTPICAA